MRRATAGGSDDARRFTNVRLAKRAIYFKRKIINDRRPTGSTTKREDHAQTRRAYCAYAVELYQPRGGPGGRVARRYIVRREDHLFARLRTFHRARERRW